MIDSVVYSVVKLETESERPLVVDLVITLKTELELLSVRLWG